jgi:hypothetical protein
MAAMPHTIAAIPNLKEESNLNSLDCSPSTTSREPRHRNMPPNRNARIRKRGLAGALHLVSMPIAFSRAARALVTILHAVRNKGRPCTRRETSCPRTYRSGYFRQASKKSACNAQSSGRPCRRISGHLAPKHRSACFRPSNGGITHTGSTYAHTRTSPRRCRFDRDRSLDGRIGRHTSFYIGLRAAPGSLGCLSSLHRPVDFRERKELMQVRRSVPFVLLQVFRIVFH